MADNTVPVHVRRARREQSLLFQLFSDNKLKNYSPYLQKGEKYWEYDKRMTKFYLNKGSQYPPFNLEPRPLERNRLADGGMTAADRAKRRQWVFDQRLSPNEPRKVPTPKGFVRNLWNVPADYLTEKLSNKIGHKYAGTLRFAFGCGVILIGGINVLFFHTTNHGNDWEYISNYIVYVNTPVNYSPGAKPKKMRPVDFMDHGFTSRKALLYKPPVSE